MPRLPDIRIEDYLTDQQKRFTEATAGLWDATEFELGARQQEAQIPPDFDAVGGMDQWNQAEQDLLEKTYRAQQQADEERQRQEIEAQAEQYRQQQQQAEAQAALAQQAEQTQQQQQESSMMDMIRSLGIPTPSDAFESLQGMMSRGDPSSSTGAFDVSAPPQSDLDAFNQFAGGMQTDTFGPEQTFEGIPPVPEDQKPRLIPPRNIEYVDNSPYEEGPYVPNRALRGEVSEGPIHPGGGSGPIDPADDPMLEDWLYRQSTGDEQPPPPDHTSTAGLFEPITGPIKEAATAVYNDPIGSVDRGLRHVIDTYGVGALERSTAEQGDIRREAEAFDAEQGLAPRSFRQQTMEPLSPEYRAAHPERATKFDEAQSEWQNLAMGASGGLGAGHGGVADDAVQAIKTLIKHGVGDDVVLAMERALADKSDLALSAVQKLTRGIPEATPPWLPDEADRAEVARQDAEIAGRPAHAGYLAEDVADAERATSGTPSALADEIGPSPTPYSGGTTRASGGSTPYDRGLTADEARQLGIPGFEDVPVRDVRPGENIRGYGNVLPGTSPEGAQFIRENVGESTPLTREQGDKWAAELLNTNPERIAELRRNAPDPTQAGVEQRALRMASQGPIEELVAAQKELQRLKQIAREAEGAVPEAVQIDMAHAVNEFAIKELAARDAIHGPTAYSRAASKTLNAQKGAYEGARAVEEAQRLENVGKAATKAAKSAQKVARTGVVDEGVLKDLGEAADSLGSKRTREALARETPKTPKPKTDKPPLTPAQLEAQEQRRVAGIANKEQSKAKREEIQKMAADARMWAKRMQKMPKYADQMRPNFEDVLVKLDEHSQAGNKVADDIRQRLTARMQEDVYEGAFKAHRATEDAHIQSVVDRIREIQNNARGPEVHLEVSKLFKELEEIGLAGKEKASSLRRQANDRGILKAGLNMSEENYDAVVKLLEDVDPADPSTMKPILALMRQPNWLDVLNEISYVNLLSNPLTHLTNITSTGDQAILRTFLRNPLKFIGSGGQTRGQVAAAKGLGASIPEGGKLAWQTMKTGINPRRLEEAVAKGEYQHIGREHLPQIMETRGLWNSGLAKKFGGAMGTALHVMSTRPLAAMDAMLGHMQYTSAIWEKAQQHADDIIRAGGDELDDFGAVIRRNSDEPVREQIANHIINNVWDYPSIIKEAGKIEDYTLFRTNRGEKKGVDLKISNALRSLSAMKNVSPNADPKEKMLGLLANFLLPFQDVPYNFTKQGLGNVVGAPMGAAGFAKAAVKGDRKEMGEQFARAGQGALLMAVPIMLARSEKDSLTGPGPRDTGQRRMWLENHKPNSYRLPGTDTWISYEGTPWAVPFATVAGVKEAWEFGEPEPGESDAAMIGRYLAGAGQGAVRGAASQSLVEPFMRNFELFGNQASENNVAQFVAALASRYSPHDLIAPVGSGMLGFLANLTDTVERDTGRAQSSDDIPEVAQDVLESRIPVLRNRLPERRGAYGEVLGKPIGRGVLGYQGEASMPNDPITEQLQEARVGMPTAPEEITIGRGQVPLTIREQQRFQQVYGEEYRKILEKHGAGQRTMTDKDLVYMRGLARENTAFILEREIGKEEVRKRWHVTPPIEVAP